ncbi:MAG: type II toxin-antitoxin system Phd/YefM family antitoxin [Thermoanaerobaculia bacterium]
MRTIRASEFKARCLQLMEEVTATGEALLITKRGRPVSVLSAYVDRPASLFGCYRDSIQIRGDLLAPIDVEWDVER